MSKQRSAKPAPYMQTVVIDGEKVRRQRTNELGELGWRLRPYDARTGTQPEQRYYGTYEDAVRELNKLTVEHTTAVTAPVAHARSRTLGDWAPSWLKSYAWKIPPSSNGSYRGSRRKYSTWAKASYITTGYLLPALGENRRLATITHDLLVDTIGGLTTEKDRPLADSSKATVAAVARAMFRDAVTAGVMTTNPAANMPTTWGEGTTSRTALIPSILEVEKLAAAMDETWPLPRWASDLYGASGEGRGDIVRGLAYTGCRYAEFAALPATMVHPKTRVLSVLSTATESGGRRQYHAEEGKTLAATRHLAIVNQAMDPLRRMNAVRKRGLALEPEREARRQARGVTRAPSLRLEERWTLLMSGEQGGFQSYGHWRKRLKVAQAACGVDYDAHDLRHVCASILYAAGESESVIAEQMGHADPAVTRRVYRHMFLVDRREVARRVELKIAAITEAEMQAAEDAAAVPDLAEADPDDDWL